MRTDSKAFYKLSLEPFHHQTTLQWIWSALFDGANLAIIHNSPLVGVSAATHASNHACPKRLSSGARTRLLPPRRKAHPGSRAGRGAVAWDVFEPAKVDTLGRARQRHPVEDFR